MNRYALLREVNGVPVYVWRGPRTGPALTLGTAELPPQVPNAIDIEQAPMFTIFPGVTTERTRLPMQSNERYDDANGEPLWRIFNRPLWHLGDRAILRVLGIPALTLQPDFNHDYHGPLNRDLDDASPYAIAEGYSLMKQPDAGGSGAYVIDTEKSTKTRWWFEPTHLGPQFIIETLSQAEKEKITVFLDELDRDGVWTDKQIRLSFLTGKPLKLGKKRLPAEVLDFIDSLLAARADAKSNPAKVKRRLMR